MGWGYKLSNKNIFSPVNTWSPSVMSSLNDCRKELINSRLAFKCTPFRDVWDHRLCAGICAYSYVHNINMHQLRPHDEIFSGFLNYIPTWKNMLCLLKYFLDVTKGVQLSQIYQEGNGLVIARNWKKFKFDSFIPLKHICKCKYTFENLKSCTILKSGFGFVLICVQIFGGQNIRSQ